ncbi:unnamed protein product [Closterium sp. NIES-53]
MVRRDFDSATLDSYDFVFGTDWLQTVSTQFDWAQGSCSVKVDEEFRELSQWSDGPTSSTAIINAVRVRQLVFLEEVEAEEGKGGIAAVGEKATLPAKPSNRPSNKVGAGEQAISKAAVEVKSSRDKGDDVAGYALPSAWVHTAI